VGLRLDGAKLVECFAVYVGLGVHDEGNDKSVKTQDLSENEDQDHADEQTWLLSGSSYTCITDDTNSETGSKTRETDTKTCTKLHKAGVEGHVDSETTGNQDGYDESVNGNDTSHDNGDGTLHHEIRTKDGHGRDADTGFCCTITSANARKDNRTCATESTEEGGVDGAVFGHGVEVMSVVEEEMVVVSSSERMSRW